MEPKTTEKRFKAVQTPDDSWEVLDETAGLPVERDGVILLGLDRETALALERYLNGMGPLETK
ncbi:hypothetical protein [Chelativorans sp. AA-79]|uniref:hypothetical protein n=1 Tax=Chelativorans sp. AA-79 TaxID=3028735 RepID=UPI0023F6BC1F|nr:hypothetical protein [Chelativorans sp. AA-79]WEX07897.1 hypothetical protein PVE73_17590 [Chelativorans sp. AA-79]